jgi:hypothetical protein
MITTVEKDFNLKINRMKRITFFTTLGLAILLMAFACKNHCDKKNGVSASENTADTTSFMLIGKDIITDIILKPDTLGDPWEVEKIKGFTGNRMFKTIFDRIYSEKMTVWDCRNDKTLSSTEIKDLEKEFNSDLSKIGKVQFTEDWYFDTNRNTIVKKIKSVSFGFAINGIPDLPVRYKALFRLKS